MADRPISETLRKGMIRPSVLKRMKPFNYGTITNMCRVHGIKYGGKTGAKLRQWIVGNYWHWRQISFSAFLDVCTMVKANPGELLNEILAEECWTGQLYPRMNNGKTSPTKCALHQRTEQAASLAQQALRSWGVLQISQESKDYGYNVFYAMAANVRNADQSETNTERAKEILTWLQERPGIRPIAQFDELLDLMLRLVTTFELMTEDREELYAKVKALRR